MRTFIKCHRLSWMASAAAFALAAPFGAASAQVGGDPSAPVGSGQAADVQTPDPAAQPGVPQAGATPTAVQEADVITVTATRVNREGYLAPTPTVVVGAEQLEQRATTNVAQFLAEVPSFRPTTQPTSNGINQRSVGSNYVDLRGLGTSRTLVLVDGQRFVPEMAAGLAGYNVNLNQIPALLVDRVEVVTGGASAQWGSDAVAGVVNILLKKKFDGFQAEVLGGTSTHGDNESIRAGFVGGKNFADDRANLTVAVDFEKNYGVGDVNTRDWGRKHAFLINNPCPNQVAVSANCPGGGNGLATNLILPDVQFTNAAPGGLITNTALRGTTFDVGGASRAFGYGQYVGPTYMQGGEQPGIYFPSIQPIAAPFWRVQSYARASYELSDAVTAHIEGSYSHSRGGGIGAPLVNSTTIRADNAYLPTDIQAQMAAGGISSFTLGRYNGEIVSEGRVTNRTARGVFGLDGEFGGESSWKWSAAAGYGINKYKQRVPDTVITQRYAFAADAVLNNGQIVCRATLPGASFNAAAAGCVPMNLFGPGSISADAAAYITGTVKADIDYKQFFSNAEISGEPFSTWAGPVSLALGAEYRHEREVAAADPIANANGYNGNNSASFRGTYSVKEAFVETVVPLLKDSALGESFDLNGAVRYADYNGSSGGQTTWKVGATYTPVSGLLLRVARSRDIRAPNIFERNVPPSGRNATISYGTSSPNILTYTQGNPDLKPEKADTLTFGFSLQPAFAPGLALSIDRYQIDTSGLITQLGAQDVADLCRVGGQQSFCDLITFNGAGTPTGLLLPFLNLASVDISGFDFQASYRLPLHRLWADLPGSLQFSFSGTYAEDSKVNSGALGARTIDRAGETGPKNQFAVPDFRSTTSLTYSDAVFSLSAQARYVSSGKYDNTFGPTQINDNDIPSRTYIDLSGTYEISEGFTLFTVVSNLFDKDPPTAPTDNASPTNAVYYDTIGRVIKAGIRIRM